MENKAGKNTKATYYILIVLFTILFFVCMAFCFVRFVKLSRERKWNSLSYRLESIELEERMYGAQHIFYSLYFQDDYEEEFDGYWDFTDAYFAYVKGRMAEDKTPYIEEIKAYLDSSPDGEKKKAAEAYLEELEGQ